MEVLFKALSTPGGIGGIVALVVAMASAIAALWVERSADRKRSIRALHDCETRREAIQEARLAELRDTVQTLGENAAAMQAMAAALKSATEALEDVRSGRYEDREPIRRR